MENATNNYDKPNIRFSTNFRTGRRYVIATSDDYFFYGEVRSVASFDVLLANAVFMGERDEVSRSIKDYDALVKITDEKGKIGFMTIPRSKIAFSICLP